MESYAKAFMMQGQSLSERDDFKELVKKEDIIRELEKLDERIMKLHISRYRCKRDFVGSPQSELLRLKRSFLFVKLCELDDDKGD